VARIYERGGIWYFDRRDVRGKRVRQATDATSKRAALAQLHELEARTQRQHLGLEPIPIGTTMTLGEACLWWLERWCPKPSHDTQEYVIKARIVGAPIGSRPLGEVSPALLEDYFHDVQTDDGLAPATVNKLRATLRTVFTRLQKAGMWSGENPAGATQPRKVPRRVYELLSLEETERLFRDGELPGDWAGFIATAAYAGLRKGEIAALRKTDVDLSEGTLTIRASYERDTTKGGHADVIPIPAPLRAFIMRALETPGPFLFPMSDGSPRTDDSSPHKVLRHAMGRAGIVLGYWQSCRSCLHRGEPHREKTAKPEPKRCPACNVTLWVTPIPRRVRFHDLRHSCATNLLRAGVPMHVVQRILRHSSINTTAGIYAHLEVSAYFGPS
jgi:integrase